MESVLIVDSKLVRWSCKNPGLLEVNLSQSAASGTGIKRKEVPSCFVLLLPGQLLLAVYWHAENPRRHLTLRPLC